MRALIQRVSSASVTIESHVHAAIGQGLLVLLGVEESDEEDDIAWLCPKICQLRIFDDEAGVMNISISEAGGEMLVISQFTLHASTRKGNRPSYIKAARPEKAIPLYESFIRNLETQLQKPVKSGVFGADMQVALVNDGPVTIMIDSKIREWFIKRHCEIMLQTKFAKANGCMIEAIFLSGALH